MVAYFKDTPLVGDNFTFFFFFYLKYTVELNPYIVEPGDKIDCRRIPKEICNLHM